LGIKPIGMLTGQVHMGFEIVPLLLGHVGRADKVIE